MVFHLPFNLQISEDSDVVKQKRFRFKNFYRILSSEYGVNQDISSIYNKKCNKHVTNAPKGIGLA